MRAPGNQVKAAGGSGVSEHRLAPRRLAELLGVDGEAQVGAGLVQRQEQLHVLAEAVEHDAGVVAEPVDDLAIGPAALLRQRLRQLPVIERHQRLDARRLQVGDEPAVVGDARPGWACPSPSGRMRGQLSEKR